MSRVSLSRLLHKSLFPLFSMFIFFASHAFADEKENSCAKSLLNLEPPPLIQEVKIQPENPKESEDVLVRAAIGNDSEKTKAVTTNAWLHYSTDDGKTETVVEMQTTEEKDADGFAVWTGKIPAQKTETKIVYYVSAKDSNGHYSTETPGESANIKFPPEEGKENGIKFSAPVPDEECPSAEGGLDILGFSVGYDEKTMYGKIVMKNKIISGEPKPLKINFIAAMFLNHDKSDDILNFKKETAFFWSPLAFEQGSAMITPRPCFVVDERVTQTKQPVPENEAGVECSVYKNMLYFKLNSTLLEQNLAKVIRTIVIAGQVLPDPNSLAIIPPSMSDASPHIYIYLRSHAYTVR